MLLNSFWMFLHFFFVFLWLSSCVFVSSLLLWDLSAKTDSVHGGGPSAGVSQPVIFLGFDWCTSHHDSVFTSRLKIYKPINVCCNYFTLFFITNIFKYMASLDPNFLGQVFNYIQVNDHCVVGHYRGQIISVYFETEFNSWILFKLKEHHICYCMLLSTVANYQDERER